MTVPGYEEDLHSREKTEQGIQSKALTPAHSTKREPHALDIQVSESLQTNHLPRATSSTRDPPIAQLTKGPKISVVIK